jgi:hypothetical protein
MANVHLTVAKPGTAVELPRDEALWLADALEALDPEDAPGAESVAARIRSAIGDRHDEEVGLDEAELDAVALSLASLRDGAAPSGQLADLVEALRRWR